MIIKLEKFDLVRYNDDKHKYLKEEFKNGNSFSEYIHQIPERLESSKYNDKNIYQSAFVVQYNEMPMGYLYISNKINDEVFLEYSVLKEYRKMGYGSELLNEITNYLFENCNIKNIRLDIDPSNKNSILLASACGFYLDEEEYEARNFIGKMQFIKESDIYISKRKK